MELEWGHHQIAGCIWQRWVTMCVRIFLTLEASKWVVPSAVGPKLLPHDIMNLTGKVPPLGIFFISHWFSWYV